MNNKDTIIKYAVGAVIVVVALLVLIWGVAKIKSKIQNTITNQKLASKANEEIDVEKRTLTDAQINTVVSKLQAAFYSGAFGWAEDEDAIYAAFNQIGSRSDLLMVEKEFGVYKDKTLAEHITSLLTQSEIDHINQILAAKQINYKY